MALKKSSKTLVEEANAEIRTVSIDDARQMFDRPDVLFVDIRDVRELQRTGTIPGAFHAPRCMMEFWVDPESPYYKPELGEAENLILFCQSSWRSALTTKTLQDMGVEDIAHLEGGFGAWVKAEAPVEPVERT